MPTTKTKKPTKPTKRAKKRGSGTKRYGALADEKVAETMHELKEGTLRSSSGEKVTSRKQAVAIGLSEARAAGGKVPAKPRDDD